MLSINDADFKEIVSNKSLVIIDFFAPWCGPCHRMTPILEGIEHELENAVGFYKLNVDENNIVAQQYKIISIPTLLFFKDGKEVKRLVGIKKAETIVETLQELA